jgi:hypothetical protein
MASKILSFVEAPLSWFKAEAQTAIAALVPPALQTKIGLFATTFAANLYHDFGPAAQTLTQEMVTDVWDALETAATNLAPQVETGKISVTQAVAAGVTALKSEAASVMLPALKQTAQTTIQSWLPNLITTSLAAASANPTSQPASSPAASSSAPSTPSTLAAS